MTAQFLSRDPVVDQTHQPYGYVGDNPLNAVDPSGLTMRCPTPNCVNMPTPTHATGSATSWTPQVRGARGCNQQLCWAWENNCAPVISAGGFCVSGSIYGGIGIHGSVCFASSHGHFGIAYGGGYGFGLGGGVSFGPFISNATCLQDLGGPFAEAGGGDELFSGNIQGGAGSQGPVWIGSAGIGLGATQGFVGATNTGIWQF
jgi:hypothetical protein